MKSSFLKSMLVALLVCFVTFFTFNNLSKINIDSSVGGQDAGESLQIVKNIIKHQTFAFNDEKNNNKFYPTNFREPLPIFLWATTLKFHGGQLDLINAKYVNLVFYIFLHALLTLIVFQIPKVIASIQTKMMFLLLLFWGLKIYRFEDKVNYFVNEIHTSTLLCLLVLQFLYFFKNPSTIKLILIGIVYGLLCLTKATFFYSGIIVFLIAIGYQLLNKLTIKSSLVVFLAAMIITTPWLVRNYLQTGQTAISGRGPETFVDRTYEEIYNDPHFVGLLYAYSPDFLKPLATKLTGYGFEDRLKGGRLQYSTRAHVVDHLARKLKDENMAINSHFKAGIWMTHVYDDIYAKLKDPVIAKKEASKVYKKFALKEMFAHPVRHLKHTLIFAWRGIWILNAIDGRTNYEMGLAKQEPLLKQILPFLGFLSLIGIFVYGVIKRNVQLMLLTIFSVAAYGFNSFFSHNIPRYGEAFLPVWMLSLVFVLLHIRVKIRNVYQIFKQKIAVV